MTDATREAWLKLVRSHMATYGHHITLVSGGPLPRFAYTVGLSPSMGVELVLAGAVSLSAAEVRRAINQVAAQVVASDGRARSDFEIDGLGRFSLLEVDGSWIGAMRLGACDFYGRGLRVMQIRPDGPHRTVDVPDLSRSWDPNAERVWRWLHEPWDYPVPPKSVAATNVAALHGASVTEVVRWEEGYWEMFAGPAPDAHRPTLEWCLWEPSSALTRSSRSSPAWRSAVASGAARPNPNGARGTQPRPEPDWGLTTGTGSEGPLCSLASH